MAEVLENIHREYSAQLDRFNGDTAPFVNVNKELTRCLEMEYKEQPGKRKSFAYAWAAAGILILALGGWLGWRGWQYHRWTKLVDALREQPGLVVTSLARERGKYVIRGMRDPLAPDPTQFVKSQGLDPASAEFHWSAYYALDDAIVQQRATQVLAPPNGTTLTVKEGFLYLSGQPPLAWVKEVSTRALLVPGIRAIDLSGPFSPERLAFNQARDKIQAVLIMFPLASATLGPKDRTALEDLKPEFNQVLGSPKILHGNVVLDIVGHSDNTGAEVTNQTLSQRRADRVLAELTQLGCPSRNLRARGVATTEPLRTGDNEESRQMNRSVTIRVLLSPVP
jgi:OOP family OmpA-OmpF porin